MSTDVLDRPQAKYISLADGLDLPLDAVTETFAILAMRRAGKSNIGVAMAECFYDFGVPWVSIDPKGDWWGIRSSKDGEHDGLSVPIFGGDHGDLPLESTTGKMIADLVADENLSLLLDISHFARAEMARFCADFAEQLLKRNREPRHIFCEEAHLYIPQTDLKEMARSVGAFNRLITLGGQRGLGSTLMSQRSAMVNKTVLEQTGTLIVLRTAGPRDRKAIKDWVQANDADQSIIDTLPGLQDGEGWVYSPHFLGLTGRFHFFRRETFDSGATPKFGESRLAARLADIDLEAFSAHLASTIERAKADDPKELRKQIARLEKELRARPSETVVETVVERVEVPGLSPEQEEALQGFGKILVEAVESVSNACQESGKLLAGILDRRGALADSTSTRSNAMSPRAVIQPGKYESPKPISASSRPPRPTLPERNPGSTLSLRAGERKILSTLARRYPIRSSRAQLGTLSGYKHTGGTFQAYVGVLKRNDLVREEQGEIWITDDGFAELGENAPREPMTTEETLDLWRGSLRAGERTILDLLVSIYPDSIDRTQLGQQTRYEPSGGTFQAYIGVLKRNGLIEVNGSEVRAADVLFVD